MWWELIWLKVFKLWGKLFVLLLPLLSPSQHLCLPPSAPQQLVSVHYKSADLSVSALCLGCNKTLNFLRLRLSSGRSRVPPPPLPLGPKETLPNFGTPFPSRLGVGGAQGNSGILAGELQYVFPLLSSKDLPSPAHP